MADAEAKAKAEKLAAAKKRVEQMKKQKAKISGTKTKKAPEVNAEGSKAEEREEKPLVEPGDDDGDEHTLGAPDDKVAGDGNVETTAADATSFQPSLSLQSKMRSSSFRQASLSGGPLSPGALKGFSPDGETAPDIFRKQAVRIEELERENKRLSKEAQDGEKRWQKAEEELEEMREADGDRPTAMPGQGTSSGDVEKLKSEIAALQRQNTQLQAQASRPNRHGSSPSISLPANSSSDLTAVLASKSSTIDSMEIEISNLRAQLARTASGSTAEKEQIAALEDKLSRTERLLETSQRELGDLKKNLERTTEKAVKEGSERTSAETKLRTLTREAEEANNQATELRKKAEGLEKKVTTLTTLHKEHDARSQALKKEREKTEKEASDLRIRLAGVENENLRLREERERAKKRDAQGIDDEGVDELENEERQRLELKVRELEGEVFELRRGIWKERRKEIDGNGDESGLTSPGAKFTEIDLSGGMSPSRRRSIAGGPAKGISDFFSAFTGAGASGGGEPLLEDDELDFDEDAFRLAQEEEARKRIERIRDIKRSLGEWNGWRLDLVETRRAGGEGLGEIFEV